MPLEPIRPTPFIHDIEALRKELPFAIEPTNIPGIYHIPAPSDDFDPSTASQTELLRNGIYWRRPPVEDRARTEAFESFFSRKWLAQDRIIPEFEIQPRKSHQLHTPATIHANGTYQSSDWAGALIASGNWICVFGKWTVPDVSESLSPSGEDGTWDSSSWIGLDGLVLVNGSLQGGNDVLQIGVEQTVDSMGRVNYVAWIEWYAPAYDGQPDYVNQSNLTNFDVYGGDEINCSLQYFGTIGALVNIANARTGQTISMFLAPPQTASFQGSSAEWIMECPKGESFGVCTLPDFAWLYFTATLACGPVGADNEGSTIQTIDIFDQFGTQQTSTTLGFLAATIEYIGK
jgi:hypothetical protein